MEGTGELGFALRQRGVPVNTLDLPIAAYALSHGVALLTTDGDFRATRAPGIPLDLVKS